MAAQSVTLQNQHAQHTFSTEERAGFADYINSVLSSDPDLKGILPINPDNDDLFNACKNGILMSKLINHAIRGTVDERAINKGATLNAFKVIENQNLAINSAKAIGCTVVNVGAQDLVEGRSHIVLGLIWQIIRIGLLAAINLKNHPYLIRLLEPGETLEDLLRLSPEEILLRWVNYHLKNAGSPKRIKNFSGDIKDSEAYTILLSQLSKKCDKNALQQSDLTKRAGMVLDNAEKIDCRKFVRPGDIVRGNAKLNLAFVANMFNTCPGLEPVTEVVEVTEETREERAFRNWMNSMGVDPYVNNIYEDLRDGIILLQLEDKVEPGIVSWPKVNTVKPLNKFKQVENDNYAIVLGKQMKFSLVGVGGQDIQAGNKMYILAIVWQAMRYYILSILKRMSKDGKEVTENDVVNWANSKVTTGRRMADFKDKSLSDSLFILDLLTALQPDSVNASLITPGQTDEQKQQNAQYAISVARKTGCTVFLLWEDICEVKPKMMLTLFAAIMAQFGQK